MACAINGDTIRQGFVNFLDKELTSSDIFTKDGNAYTAKNAQEDAAQSFVGGLNRRFSEKVITNSKNTYTIHIPDTLIEQYIVSSSAGQDLANTKNMYFDFAIAPQSWNFNTTFSALNYPEISEFTYNNLISFLQSVNPKFQVQEVHNLSSDGVTKLKDFLVQVRTMSKFSALPEEVAHVLVELLPDDHALKTEAIANITSFQIYSDTLAKYKSLYLLPNGNPDYEKIKREATAKLVGAYVTALSTGNNTEVNELTKPKGGWIARWFAKFVEFLGLNMLKSTQAYSDIAGVILSGKTDISLKNEQDIADMSYTDSYFFRASDQELYASSYEIIKNPPPKLLEIISNFTKEFGRTFNEILKDEKYVELNEMLKRNGEDTGKINRLSEIKIILGEASIDLRAALDSTSFLTGVKQFLEAVDRLDILSDSLLKVIASKEKAKTFDEAIKNITELEGYFGIYETFNNIISADLAQALIDSNVASDVIESIQRTQIGFKNVNDHILNKLKNDLFIFYKSILATSNSVAAQTLADDMERFKDDPKAIKFFKERLDRLITSDDDIMKMLSGKGRDIDNFSSVNHLINAARANGDVYLAGIAGYIYDRINRAQVKGAIVIRDLYQRIDPIQKQLNESANTTGSKITFIDTVYDRDTGGVRNVLTWMNPHKNIQVALETHRTAISDAASKRQEADKNSEAFKEADEVFKKAQKDYSEFLEKYYNRPFVKEYYDFRKKFESDTDFISAMGKWQNFSEIIKSDEALLLYQPDSEAVWSSLSINRRKRANLLNESDESGQLKSESELKEVRILKAYFEEQSKFREDDKVQTDRSFRVAENRYEQKVDFVIFELIKKNLSAINDVENELQKLMNDTRLRVASLYLEEYPKPKSIDYDYIKKLVMDKWRKKNVTIQRNEAFYAYEAEIHKQLEELQKNGQLSQADINIKNAYNAIRHVLFGSRDEIGQINPNTLTEEERDQIVSLEDYINEQKQDKPGVGINPEDFTPEDRVRYEDLTKVIGDDTMESGRRRTAIRQRNDIIKKYKNSGRSKAIRELLEILGSLTKKSPTIYYWDKMITLIPKIAEFGRYAHTLDLDEQDKFNINLFVYDFVDTIDREDWDRLDFVIYEQGLFDVSFLDWLKDNHPDDFDWFIDNHLEKTVFDHENERYAKIKYARSAVYNYTEPTREDHMKEVKNRKFRKYRVKNEYRTGYNPETKEVELQVGTHITNREYNGFPEFMPLLPEQGAPTDSPYRNEAYYDLRDKDPLRFQYLTELRNADLAHQEKTPSRLKRWNQVPVMHLSHIEEKDPTHLIDLAKQKIDYVGSIFKKDSKLAATGADAEEAASGADTAREIDQFTQTTIEQRIPKLGMSQKIPIERVSRDLLKSTAQFILRAHEFEARVGAEPVVKTLIRVLKNNKEGNEFKNQMSNKERIKTFEKIYSQMILQEVPDTTLNTKAIRRIAKFLTGNTAYRMLADPIGGIINYSSAMVNNIIEASAGQYLNLVDLAKGKALAFRVNMNLVADYNKKANLSVDTLLYQTFEFIQGEFEEDLLDRSSSKDKHASIRQMLMIPRKSGELMAQTATAMGILERNKVKNSIDGREYPMHEIYTREGNNLKLKEGFPQEYNPVDGDKFFKIKGLINRVNLELHGNYAKLDQSEASRYAIGKLAENMKRWFMPAFQRRFGRETIDLVYENPNEGYYRTGARAARNMFGSMLHLDFPGAGRWLNVFMKTPRYRQNLQRLGAEMAMATLFFLTFSVLLGYSGDDKNKELDNNSWVHNTAILLALRIYSETTAYIPFPPFGFQEMKRNVVTPFSLPIDAVSNFAAIGQLGLYQVLYWFGADGLKDDLYYQKNSGYWYSEKGDSKLIKYMLRAVGYTGYTGLTTQGFDAKQVATYIKQFDNLQKRLK